MVIHMLPVSGQPGNDYRLLSPLHGVHHRARAAVSDEDCAVFHPFGKKLWLAECLAAAGGDMPAGAGLDEYLLRKQLFADHLVYFLIRRSKGNFCDPTVTNIIPFTSVNAAGIHGLQKSA